MSAAQSVVSESSFIVKACLTFRLGPIISSYAVEGRRQVADLDASMLIEDFDEPEAPPCPICGLDDNEEVLLLCDGCDASYHTYCVDLNSVPAGSWHCADCTISRLAESEHITRLQNPTPAERRDLTLRTRGQQRQVRNHNQAASSNWARVWQTVWDHLNIDLDFPFDGRDGVSQLQRTQSSHVNNSRELLAWQHRFRVAERQGGTNRFHETAATLLDPRPTSRPRPELPEPESTEEILAWNALEKARDIDADPTPKSRKRKSATNSPTDKDRSPRKRRRKSNVNSPSESAPSPQVERRLKRPQTRRIPDSLESSGDNVESCTISGKSLTSFHNAQLPESVSTGNGPSFLQSLLKEVEASASPDQVKGQNRPIALQPSLMTSDHSSPRLSSPGASPITSNYPSPRALSRSPPPSRSARPGSPVLLTSKVEPVYPTQNFSPTRSPPPDHPLSHRSNHTAQPHIPDGRGSHLIQQNAPESSPPRSEIGSPNRAGLSLSVKSDLQMMVKDALSHPYKNDQVTKDQYTEINRKISRMLYKKVGDLETLHNDTKDKWRKMANEEVVKAVRSLEASSTMT